MLAHHLGNVISQSFSATEETFARHTGRGARTACAAPAQRSSRRRQRHGARRLRRQRRGRRGAGRETYYTYPVTSWPDSDPLVTGVGGTEIKEGAVTTTTTRWRGTTLTTRREARRRHAGPYPPPAAALSILFSRPSYQNGSRERCRRGPRRAGHLDERLVHQPGVHLPELPAEGFPAGWYPSCGTSEATPEFAGIVALADQVAGHPLGLINPTLYKLAAGAKAPGIVPVTSGNNTVSFTQGTARRPRSQGFNAQARYSLVNGVGTVNAAYFVYELAGKSPAEVSSTEVSS